MQKQEYKTVRDIAEIEKYFGAADVISFDFETSATDDYRDDDKAALDAHKSEITGVSFSVEPGTGIYVPFRHRVGENANPQLMMAYLKSRVFQNTGIVKIAHNMAFEAMFLYKDELFL